MEKIINQIINDIEKFDRKIKVGFPDGDDKRIIEASKMLQNIKNIESIIINQELMSKYNKEDIIEIFKKARGDKNTLEEFEQWVSIPNYFAMALLEMNEIDCVVGGATTPTADLLRPALQIVKSKDNLITSFFWMNKGEENYFLGDCAIVPYPNADQLTQIGKLISDNVKNIFNFDTSIAMLSFSTNGSAPRKLEGVNNVYTAAMNLQKQNYNVLGETQFDAAFDYETRKYKWKKDIKERPNVYVFPNLDAGNIGYKIMKLTGGFEAIGPIIVGLNKPINDLSRGANSEEVYNLSIITINMFLKGVNNG